MTDTADRVKKIVAEHLGVEETTQTLLTIWVLTAWIPLNWLWHSKKNSVAKFLMKQQKKFLQ